MSPLEAIINELKTLPPDRLKYAADYIHKLQGRSRQDRNSVLDETAGSLKGEIADSMMAAIEEGCERVDPDGW